MPGNQKKNNRKMKAGGPDDITSPDYVHSPEYFTDEQKTSEMVKKRVDEFNASSEEVLIFGPPPYGKMKVSAYESLGEGKIGFPYQLYYKGQSDEAGNLINGLGKKYMFVVNTAMPYTEWYDVNTKQWTNKDGSIVPVETVLDKAGMSFVHFLAVPEDPLFNTVSLKPSHKDMLLDMKKTLLEQLKDKAFKQKAIDRVLKNILEFPDNKKPASDFTPEQRALFDEKAKIFMDTDFNESNMEFFLHVAYIDPVSGAIKGNQSIPQLHLHCLQKENTGLRTSHRHDKKNMPLDAVLKYLDPSYTGTGGKKNNANDFKKTDEKVKVGGKELCVHVNKRGTKHIKRGGEFVNLNKALKDAEKKKK